MLPDVNRIAVIASDGWSAAVFRAAIELSDAVNFVMEDVDLTLSPLAAKRGASLWFVMTGVSPKRLFLM